MAYEYDRFEREEGSGAFLMGLLAGTVLGAGLGMLFAPRAGADLRNQLSEQAGKLKNTASDAYQQASDKVTQFVERGKDAYDRARTTAARTADQLGVTGTTGDQTSTGYTGSGSTGTGYPSTGSTGSGNTGFGSSGSNV
jgi:gas vesicle protein